MSYMLILLECELWITWLSLYCFIWGARFDGIVAGRPWVSLLGPELWWFGWSSIMASGSL